jgi:nucleoside-diphosphate-sugar epimerase
MHHPTDVRDVAEGILLTLETDAAVGESFNLFAAEGTSWESAARYIHQSTGRPIVNVILPNSWAFCCDISKARRLLGYDPQYDWRRMVDDAIRFSDGEDIGIIPE